MRKSSVRLPVPLVPQEDAILKVSTLLHDDRDREQQAVSTRNYIQLDQDMNVTACKSGEGKENGHPAPDWQGRGVGLRPDSVESVVATRPRENSHYSEYAINLFVWGRGSIRSVVFLLNCYHAADGSLVSVLSSACLHRFI